MSRMIEISGVLDLFHVLTLIQLWAWFVQSRVCLDGCYDGVVGF